MDINFFKSKFGVGGWWSKKFGRYFQKKIINNYEWPLSRKKNVLGKRHGLHTLLCVWLLTITREVVFKAKDDC